MTKTPPALPPNIDKSVHTTDPDGTTVDWVVLDEIRGHKSDDKLLVLQRLRRKDIPHDEMFRFGYYIIGQRPKMKGKWTWGQYAPFISVSDFSVIIQEAINRKWLT